MSESLFNATVTELVEQGKEAAYRIEELLDSVNERLMTKENLFKRLVNLEQQMETLKSDIKAAKEDFTFDEDMNPKGLPKEDVKEVAAFAKKYVTDKIEAVIEQAKMFEALKEELIGE